MSSPVARAARKMMGGGTSQVQSQPSSRMRRSDSISGLSLSSSNQPQSQAQSQSQSQSQSSSAQRQRHGPSSQPMPQQQQQQQESTAPAAVLQSPPSITPLNVDMDEQKYEGHFHFIADRILVACQPPMPPPSLSTPDPLSSPKPPQRQPPKLQQQQQQQQQQTKSSRSPKPGTWHGSKNSSGSSNNNNNNNNNNNAHGSLGSLSYNNDDSDDHDDDNDGDDDDDDDGGVVGDAEEEEPIEQELDYSSSSLWNQVEKIKESLLPPPSAVPHAAQNEDASQSVESMTYEGEDESSLPAVTPYWTRISRFLEERQFLWIALDEFPPDHDQPAIYAALHGQVVELPWEAAGPVVRTYGESPQQVSSTPTLGTLLRICYTAAAMLQTAEPTCVVVLACRNGQSKTALAAAALLRFLDKVQSTKYGFCHFVACSRQNAAEYLSSSQDPHHYHHESKRIVAPDALWDALPPSIRNVLTHVDDILEQNGDYWQRYPLRLKAIALQGIPVDEKPCIEVWNTTGELLYASHLNAHPDAAERIPQTLSHWSDEEGFYRIQDYIDTNKNRHETVEEETKDVLLQGDFCLVGRFGGTAHEYDGIYDTSKWLFRYVQSTAFMSDSGIVELAPNRVDLMRRYAAVMGDDFLLSLVIEPYWKQPQHGHKSPYAPTPCSPNALPPVYQGRDALEEGWRSIAQYHVCQPSVHDVENCRQMYRDHLAKCPPHILRLALQMGHGHAWVAHSLLTIGCLYAWWHVPSPPPVVLKRPPWNKHLIWDGKKFPKTSLQDAIHLMDDLKFGHDGNRDDHNNNNNNNDLDHDFCFTDPFDAYFPKSKNNNKENSVPLADEKQKTEDGQSAEKSGRANLMAAMAANSAASVSNKDKDESANKDISHGDGVDVAAGNGSAATKDGGRSNLMAAIAAKGGSQKQNHDDAAMEDGGRGNLMAAIAAKGGSQKQNNDAAAVGDGGRGSLMAAIAAKGSGAAKSGDDKAADGGRGNLMAAIAAKGGSQKQNHDAAAVGDGGRGSLMAAIAAKGGTAEKESSGDGGRGDLLASIAARSGGSSKANNAIPASLPKTPDAADNGRGNLMAAIAARGTSKTEGNDSTPDGGRGDLMAAIAAKGSVRKGEESTDGGRGSLMAAIAAKGGAPKKEAPEEDGGRGSLMAAIAAKGATKNDKPSSGRGNLMAAIAAKGSASNPKGDTNVVWGKIEDTVGEKNAGMVLKQNLVTDEVPISASISSLMNANVGDIYNCLVPSTIGSIASVHKLVKEGGQNRPLVPFLTLGEDGRRPPLVGSLDDPGNREAVELLLRLQHLGVTLNDLIHLLEVSRLEWNQQLPAEIEEPSDSAKNTDSGAAVKESSLAKDEAKADATSLEEEKKEDISAPPPADESEGKPAMKNDSRFAKYWKMKSVGLPDGAVMQAMTKDGVDPKIIELDWNKNYEEQTAKEEPSAGDTNGDGPPMKKDERFVKYWKMKSVGLPDGAVMQAMSKDGLDPKIIDLDWDKNYEAQTQPAGGAGESQSSGPPMKEDDRFVKYWKMKSVGLPDGAVMQAMTKDGLDPKIIDLDWNKNYEAQTQPAAGAAAVPSGPPMKEDERFAKYWKMKSVGLPDGAVMQAMMKDGVDPKAIDLDWDKNYEAQTQPATGSADVPTGPPMKEDERFAKYWKMKSVGLPDGAVMQAMMKDGVDPKAVDLDWDKNYEAQTQPSGGAGADSGPPLKDDPEYAKYFKMLGVGLPLPAVQNAMSRDGKDPKILDLDPNKSVASQMKTDKAKKGTIKKKKRVRRKKIYWTPIDPGQIQEDSLWHIVRGISMTELKYDEKEFEELFTESADPADKKKTKEKKPGAEKAQKKSVQVIDGKRSMNGGIAFARLRMDYNTIATMVDKLNMGSFDTTQLKALKENLPTSEERRGLEAYMSKAGNDEEKKAALYADFSECEKYMYTMMKVDKADKKFDCMSYRSQFQGRYDELMDAIKLIETACDEVRNSERLRTIMGMILVLVNQINTGGEGGGAAQGFSLEALLKLDEAKAFDKKTSVLQYLVKLIMGNDKELLEFAEDLKTGKLTSNLILDSLVNDMKTLGQELGDVIDIAREDAERAEKNGERSFSLQDLKEQKSSVHYSSSGVPQFNKMDHKTGRTPMERFVLNAEASIKQAIEYADSVQQKFVKLLNYFGEDEKMASDDFFKTMNRFMEAFANARTQVEKAEMARLKEEKKRKQEEEKKKKAEAKLAKAKPKPKDEEKKNEGGSDLLAALSLQEATATDGNAENGVGRAGLMAAIASKKGSTEDVGGGPGKLLAAVAVKGVTDIKADYVLSDDGRGDLMAAIAAKSGASKTDAADGGRGNLMAAIAAKSGASKTNAADGGRGNLMAAIAAKSVVSKTDAADDGRGNLMAAIAAKGAASKTKPSDGGRGSLMAAIAAKGGSENEENTDTQPADGGRGNLLAANAAKGGGTNKEDGSQPSYGGRGNLLAAIAAKGRTKNEGDCQPGDGGRGHLLAAAVATKGGGTKNEDYSQPADGGRCNLLAAIAARVGTTQKSGDDSAGDGGRGDLMAAIAAKGADAKKQSRGSEGGGRGDLMAAIAANELSTKSVTADGDRGDLLAVTAAKGVNGGNKDETRASAGDSGREGEGLLAAVAAKGGGAAQKKTSSIPSSSSSMSSDGGRGDLMAAISAKGEKSQTNEGVWKREGGRLIRHLEEDNDNVDQDSTGCVSGQSDLMVQIAARGSVNPSQESSQTKSSGNPRSGLMAAISARKVDV